MDGNVFPWIVEQFFICPKQLNTVAIKIEQNLGLHFFVILEILNAIDRPIVHWLSKTSGLPNKGRPTEERELCAGRCGEGPSLFFSPFVFLLAYEDTFLHIISPSEYTFTLLNPISLWTFFVQITFSEQPNNCKRIFKFVISVQLTTDMSDLWPHL